VKAITVITTQNCPLNSDVFEESCSVLAYDMHECTFGNHYRQCCQQLQYYTVLKCRLKTNGETDKKFGFQALRTSCKEHAVQLNTQIQRDTGYLHVIQLWLMLRLNTSLFFFMMFARLYCKENNTWASAERR